VAENRAPDYLETQPNVVFKAFRNRHPRRFKIAAEREVPMSIPPPGPDLTGAVHRKQGPQNSRPDADDVAQTLAARQILFR